MNPEVLAWALAQAEGTRWRELAEAYASGTLEVRFADGRAVRYRDAAHIATILCAGHAADAGSSARRPARTIAVVGDGFR